MSTFQAKLKHLLSRHDEEDVIRLREGECGRTADRIGL